MAETFRCEYVRCGKPGCRSCPHGPYWYAYWREGKRTRKRYVGKNRDPFSSDPRDCSTHPQDLIFNDRTASRAIAVAILGVSYGATDEEVKRAYRKLSLENHPDRGGDAKVAARLNAAYQYLTWKAK